MVLTDMSIPLLLLFFGYCLQPSLQAELIDDILNAEKISAVYRRTTNTTALLNEDEKQEEDEEEFLSSQRIRRRIPVFQRTLRAAKLAVAAMAHDRIPIWDRHVQPQARFIDGRPKDRQTNRRVGRVSKKNKGRRNGGSRAFQSPTADNSVVQGNGLQVQ
jgi:hypothetical protein